MDGLARAQALVVAVVLLGAVVPAAAVGQEAPETDNTVTRIAVQADGDGRWRVTIRTRLENDSEVRKYRAFQERFRNETARYLDPFRERIRSVVTSAANATGREMRATNFSASTSIQQVPRRWGVVTYTFTWTGFARTTDGAVVVGDVFRGGFYLSRNDTLTISGPATHQLASVDPAPTTSDGGTVTWVGPIDFADQRPHARYQQVESVGPGGMQPRDGGLTSLLVGIAAVILAVIGGILYRRREGGGSEQAPPIRTDADRVRALLQEQGGRMKQSAIAADLDWSASKTSRVVSDLEEEGVVEKMRIGRENVITLADDGGP